MHSTRKDLQLFKPERGVELIAEAIHALVLQKGDTRECIHALRFFRAGISYLPCRSNALMMPWTSIKLLPMQFPSWSPCCKSLFLAANLKFWRRCVHTVSMAVLGHCAQLLRERNVEGMPDVYSALSTCGAVLTIILSMQQFPDDRTLQKFACSLLAGIANETEEGATSIVIDGGRQIIERAKRQHANKEQVRTPADLILDAIGEVDEIDRCHTQLPMQESPLLWKELSATGIPVSLEDL